MVKINKINFLNLILLKLILELNEIKKKKSMCLCFFRKKKFTRIFYNNSFFEI